MSVPTEMDELVEELSIPHRARAAYYKLLRFGFAARPAVERGLEHENPDVRFFCTCAMDHLAGSESFGKMLSLLDDDNPRVRLHALHGLACDRCKADDVCTPAKSDVLPAAIEKLQSDPDAHVRAMAIEVVGRWVHDDTDAEAALVTAREGDPSPAVRKKAGWYAPGGTIYLKTKPKLSRT